MTLLPGFSSKAPALPPASPPPPTREDPEIAEAKDRLRQSERRRRGRAASILTDPDTLGSPTIERPRAGATMLGG